MRFSLKFFVSQNFRAYEYFVRTRLARQTFRRCIALSDSLSGQGEKKQRRFAAAIPNEARKAACLSSWRLSAAVQRAAMALSRASHESSDLARRVSP
jgi:hypothetical protein